MAPLPTITNVFRCAFNWREASTGQIGVNVMHFRAPGFTAEEVATAVDSIGNLEYWSPMVTDAYMVQFDVTPLDGAGATHSQAPTHGGWGGSQSGDFSPASAVVVSFKTALRGRSHRGRIYLPFIAEAVISDGQLTGAQVTALNTGWAAFISSAAGAGVTPVVASYKLSTAADITGTSVISGLGTQRRRQGRVRYP